MAALPELEDHIDRGHAVLGAAGAAADLVGEALRCLENGVEVVVVVDLSHAVLQKSRVSSSVDELAPQSHRATARLAKCLSLGLGCSLPSST